MRIDSPFHEGELDVQKRASELEEGQRNGRVLRHRFDTEPVVLSER